MSDQTLIYKKRRTTASGASARLERVRLSSRAVRPRPRPLILVTASLVLLSVVGPIAVAAQETEEGTETTQTTVDDGGAAVPVPPAEEADEDLPWTARYLPVTIVALTVLTIGGVAAYYFFRIRGRYEVVEG